MPKHLISLVADAQCGSETFIRREAAALRRRGWSVTPFGLGDRSAAAVPAIPMALAWRQCRPYLLRHPRQWAAVWRRLPLAATLAARCRESGAVAIQAHFAWITADLAALAAAASRTPLVCSVHAWDVFGQSRSTLRHRLAPAAAVVACTRAAAAAAAAAGLPSERIHVVHHGLDRSAFPFRPDRPPRPTVLALGRLVPKKGWETLLDAVPAVAAAVPQLAVRLVGDGPLVGALARRCRRLGVAGRVTLEPAIAPEAVPARLAWAQVLALPSRRVRGGDRDGVANVLLEAMASGTAVVSTTAGAAAEAVDSGRSGLLVPPEDPAALAQGLIDLLADAPRRERMAREARAVIETRFDADDCAARLEELILSMSHQKEIVP